MVGNPLPGSFPLAPRVSICLPTFNGDRFVADAIDSVLNQSFQDFELIIIDDSSADGSFELIENYAAKDARIKFFANESRRGLFANYNACMQMAEGEYLKLFAQDDVLHKDALAECVRVLDENPHVSIVSLQRAIIDGDGQPVGVATHYRDRLPEDISIGVHEIASQCLFPINNCIGEPSTVMFRQKDQGTGFNVDLLQVGDIEYWIRIAMAGDVYLSSKQYCSFRRHQGSKTTANTNSLAGASDVITIAKRYSWLFDVCARSEQEFIEMNLADLSRHTRLAVERGELDKYRVRLSGEMHKQSLIGAGSKEEIEFLYDHVESFRELAFHCLSYMSQPIAHTESIKQSEVRHTNVKKIDGLEVELRNLLDSYSWRMTKPLRDIKKLMLLAGADKEPGAAFKESTGLDVTYQQEIYIYHLRSMISKVKASQSWRITEPLRFRVQRRN